MKKEMRRKDRDVTDRARIEEVLLESQVLHLGLKDEEDVYVVPLNYGYEFVADTLMLYCHSASEGRKIDLIGEGTSVGFSLESRVEHFSGNTACLYGNLYKSIIGHGKAVILTDEKARLHALNRIMAHYSGKADWVFDKEMLALVKVIAICVEDYSCKIHE